MRIGWILCLWLAQGCAEPAPSLQAAPLPASQVAPPTPVFPDLVPGEVALLEVQSVTPGSMVYFIAGGSLGAGPCPPALLGTCVEVRNPRLLGTATAGGNGRAVLAFDVPAAIPLDALFLQAVVVNGSNSVSVGPVEVAITRPGDLDEDGDGLTLAAELAAGTDPADSDSDDDGLLDGVEVELGLDPLWWDTDLDTLSDSDEVQVYGTDGTLFDTDADGLPDPSELTLGTDPLVADTDGDGLVDGLELLRGTDPLLADSDGDGIPDREEQYEPPAESYIGGWPTQSESFKAQLAAEVTGERMGRGSRFPRASFIDQYGELVDIYDFAGDGKPVMISMVDLNCEPCMAAEEWIAGRTDLWYTTGQDVELEQLRQAVQNGDIHWVTYVYSSSFQPWVSTPEIVQSEVFSLAGTPAALLADEDLVVWDFAYDGGMPQYILLDDHMDVVDFGIGFGISPAFQDAIFYVQGSPLVVVDGPSLPPLENDTTGPPTAAIVEFEFGYDPATSQAMSYATEGGGVPINPRVNFYFYGDNGFLCGVTLEAPGPVGADSYVLNSDIAFSFTMPADSIAETDCEGVLDPAVWPDPATVFSQQTWGTVVFAGLFPDMEQEILSYGLNPDEYLSGGLTGSFTPYLASTAGVYVGGFVEGYVTNSVLIFDSSRIRMTQSEMVNGTELQRGVYYTVFTFTAEQLAVFF